MAIKRNCEIVEVSKPHDINNNGYDENAARYMANTRKQFNDSLAKALDKLGGVICHG